MTTVHGPIVSRRRLRTALRQAREAAGLTQEDVAERSDWSVSKVIRIESGTVNISVTDLKALLRLYRITEPAEVTELVELARVGRSRAWWTAHKDSVPPAYLSYIGLEAEASTLRYYQSGIFPGILQTHAYAAAISRRLVPEVPPALIDERVWIRMTRQREVLHRPAPPRVRVVLDEAVLRRTTGGHAIMREQLHHLMAQAGRPHISIRIHPFTADTILALVPFTILEFADPVDTDVVYLENAVDLDVIDRQRDQVDRYRRAFQALEAAALGQGESLALIAKVAGEL